MAYKDEEQEKNYQKEYYKNNKDKIVAKNACKEECVFCGRCVNHMNMGKHMKSKLCMNRREIHKAKLELLQKLVNTKNADEQTAHAAAE